MHRKSLKFYLLLNIIFLCFWACFLFAERAFINRVETQNYTESEIRNTVISDITGGIADMKAAYRSYAYEGGDRDKAALQITKSSRLIQTSVEANPKLFSSTDSLSLYSRIISQVTFSLEKTYFEKLDGQLNTFDAFAVIRAMDNGFSVLQSELTNLFNSYIAYSANEWNQNNVRYKTLNAEFTLAAFAVMAALTISLILTALRLSKGLMKINTASVALANRKWDFDDLQLSDFEELQNTAEAFNRMKYALMENIRMLEENLALEKQLAEKTMEAQRQELLIQQTRFNLLQAQINPHFLFNTLNMIYHNIKTGADKEVTAELLRATSNLLRKSIEITAPVIMLHEELALLDSYITIQRIRNGERIRFSLEVEDELKDVPIPPFTLQPLVENALVHGLSDAQSGEVSVQLFSDDDGVFIIVSDDGKGMDAETKEKVVQGTLDTNGLGNVIKRLKTVYENEDVVKVTDSHPGTSIILRICKLKETYRNAETADCRG